jgi:hypothetical protein
VFERPAHLTEHPSAIQEAPMTTQEQWLREGVWGSSMVLDSPYVQCPGCKQLVYDEKTGQHAEKCEPLKALTEARP